MQAVNDIISLIPEAKLSGLKKKAIGEQLSFQNDLSFNSIEFITLVVALESQSELDLLSLSEQLMEIETIKDLADFIEAIRTP